MFRLKNTFVALAVLLSGAVAFLRHGFSLDFILLFVSLLLFVYLSYIDLNEKEIDVRLIAVFIVLAFGYFLKTNGFNYTLLIFAVFLSAIIPLFLVLVSRQKWMGWGDVFLSVAVGAICGYPAVLVAIFFAYLLGALSGIITLWINRQARVLAFGPHLFIGCLVAILFSSKLISLYYNLIGF